MITSIPPSGAASGNYFMTLASAPQRLPSDEISTTRHDRRPLHLCVLNCVGAIAMLGAYGLLQEHIMSSKYGKEQELFQDTVFLVFCNRIVGILFAVSMLRVTRGSFKNEAPLRYYWMICFSNVVASTCQYEALKFVSFTVQMLAKSFKMMPVMIWGMLISGKAYAFGDWVGAACVTGGVVEFLLTGPTHSGTGGNTALGLALLLIFLACDSFTSTFQDKLFKEHVTSKYNQMLYINMGAALIAAFCLLISGGFTQALKFATAHPPFCIDAFALSLSAVGGQWFIYSQVEDFGALVLAATMNLRQIVSIVFSYKVYSHSITEFQIMGLSLVFFGLFWRSAMEALSPERFPLTGRKLPAVMQKLIWRNTA